MKKIRYMLLVIMFIAFSGCELLNEKDKNAPVFSNIPTNQNIEYGTDLDLLSLGLTAIDNVDGDLTDRITVDVDDTTILTVGKHTITYTVTDTTGNDADVKITLIVETPARYFSVNLEGDTITNYDINGGTDVVIPKYINGKLITKVGDVSFVNNNLTSVIIPDSVTYIGDYAFRDNHLTSVLIPDNVIYIGDFAFENSKLTSVTIPDSVTTIGRSAFENNVLTNVTLGNGLKTIGRIAFYRNSLKSIIIPDNVTTIGDYAFRDNDLTSVTIGKSVTTIGKGAFRDNHLTSVTIPDCVITIGVDAFRENNITSITIEGDNTRFNDRWIIIGFPEELM